MEVEARGEGVNWASNPWADLYFRLWVFLAYHHHLDSPAAWPLRNSRLTQICKHAVLWAKVPRCRRTGDGSGARNRWDGCICQARMSLLFYEFKVSKWIWPLQLEYDNIEGMILLSELSRRRIRSVQKLIRLGRNEVVVVLRVDKEKGAFRIML